MVNLYYWRTDFLKDIEELSRRLRPEDAERLKNITSEKRLRDFVSGRVLLGSIVTDQNAKLMTSKNGKPILSNRLQISLSHSHGAVALAVSTGEALGIDVESPRRGRDVLALAKSYGTQKEIDYLTRVDRSLVNSEFYKIWTLKEAFGKATGEGLTKNLKNLEFDFKNDLVKQSPDSQACCFNYFEHDGRHFAICRLSEAEYSIQFHEVIWKQGQFQYRELKDVHFKKFIRVVPSVAARYQ